MDKYLFFTLGLVIFSIIVILYIRLFSQTPTQTPPEKNSENSETGDNFTLLE
jgi:hypothetical protein